MIVAKNMMQIFVRMTEEYTEDFRRVLLLLTKDAVDPDFRVELNVYYLEHDADLEVEYDR